MVDPYNITYLLIGMKLIQNNIHLYYNIMNYYIL